MKMLPSCYKMFLKIKCIKCVFVLLNKCRISLTLKTFIIKCKMYLQTSNSSSNDDAKEWKNIFSYSKLLKNSKTEGYINLICNVHLPSCICRFVFESFRFVKRVINYLIENFSIT